MRRHITSSGPKVPNTSIQPSIGFADDMSLLCEWGDATGWSLRMARRHPLLGLTAQAMPRLVNKALALAAAAGVSVRSVWSLEDLLEPRLFRTVMVEADKHLPAYQASQLQVLLIAIARDWVMLSERAIADLQAIVPPLPAPHFRSYGRTRRSVAAHRAGPMIAATVATKVNA